MTDACHHLRLYHRASGKRSLGSGQRPSLLIFRRALNSSLSAPERAIKAEPGVSQLGLSHAYCLRRVARRVRDVERLFLAPFIKLPTPNRYRPHHIRHISATYKVFVTSANGTKRKPVSSV